MLSCTRLLRRRRIELDLRFDERALGADQRVVVRHERLQLCDRTFDAGALRLEVGQRDLHLLGALLELLKECRFVHLASPVPPDRRPGPLPC